MTNEEMRKRFVGSLYGVLVGDSLGARFEGLSASATQSLILKCKQSHSASGSLLPMVGGGKGWSYSALEAGQITDDSEMMLMLARSLLRQGGFRQEDVACSYAYWMSLKPPTAGHATRAALIIDEQLPHDWFETFTDVQKFAIRDKILRQSCEKNYDSLSNGSLMRIAPLVIYCLCSDLSKIDELAEADCRLTHSNPTLIDAVQVYVRALCELIRGKSIEDVYHAARSGAKSNVVHRLLIDARNGATPVFLPPQQITAHDKEKFDTKGLERFLTDIDTHSCGYFGVAFQSAFNALFTSTPDNFASQLEQIISRGGDTDTNAAIAGALLGARYGADVIPNLWLDAVRRAPLPRISGRVPEKIKRQFSAADADDLFSELWKMVLNE